ncbi:Hypothetical Protein RradSPS_2087 [Rubrobacter radiotolerans]|uniref:Uncharacterized protein n=1 Tax=Rubrobacter radiotolerans TaxID=42256 RepID=A0A023X5T7_RUBRA|nr:hypothetical protein [Rubrobacter radiotolerans]AHY47370.1 Hypothetical Protein RradSPS_2087 [Rubrobacter radiotolerans]MDX5894774.1 hypothetical protein [Rubrobacter radiotolerans]SMC06741.1 conserved hypothetical protein [Rubrobacter radiotolerans DSM 5868]
MVTVVELVEGHYEVHESPYARSYVWCPGCVTVECECGERLHARSPEEAVCAVCGRDHARTVRGRLDELEGRNGEAHWCAESNGGPERSEWCYWEELNELD